MSAVMEKVPGFSEKTLDRQEKELKNVLGGAVPNFKGQVYTFLRNTGKIHDPSYMDLMRSLEEPDLERAGETFNSTAGGASASIGSPTYEPKLREFVPYYAPILEMMPRVQGEGISTGAQQISAWVLPAQTLGAPEGSRGPLMTTTTSFRTYIWYDFALDGSTTMRALRAGKSLNIDDLEVLTWNTMAQAKIAEDKSMLWGFNQANGGNGGTGGVGIGAVTTVTATATLDATYGAGTWGAGVTNRIGVVALTPEGYYMVGATGVVQTKSVTPSGSDPAFTVYGGSTPATLSANWTSDGTHTACFALWTAVKGAAAYAVYAGVDATHAYFIGTTTTNSMWVPNPGVIANQVSTAVTTDYSQNLRTFDGIVPTALFQGGYYKHFPQNLTPPTTLLSTPTSAVSGDYCQLKPDGSGNIVQIKAMCKAMALAPLELTVDTIVCGLQVYDDINSAVMSNQAGTGANAIFTRPGVPGTAPEIQAGAMVTTIKNPFALTGNGVITIIKHPYMPPGMLVAFTLRLPVNYSRTNTPALAEMQMLREWESNVWPKTNWTVGVGVSATGVMVHYFPAAYAVFDNITAGYGQG